MTAYTRIVDFLKEIGAECTAEPPAGAGDRISEWRLGGRRFIVRGEGDGQLRLYELRCQSTSGRPDPIMDSVSKWILSDAA